MAGLAKFRRGWADLWFEVGEEVPEGDGGAGGDVEGVLYAVLRNFKHNVAGVDQALVYAFYFVAGYDDVFAVAFGMKALQRYAVVGLLEGADGPPLLFQGGDDGEGVVGVSPSYGLFGT